MKARKHVAEHYRWQNETAARVILTNPAKYGGESAALVQWARSILKPKDA